MSYKPVNESWQELIEMDGESMWVRILADLETQYESGDASALMDAVHYCLEGAAVPEWVRREFAVAWLLRWDGGQVRTLGEAFSIGRPKGWSQKRARKDVMIHVIWQAVLAYRQKHNAPIDRDLFEAVAEELTAQGQHKPESLFTGIKINGTDVQEAFYAHKGNEKN